MRGDFFSADLKLGDAKKNWNEIQGLWGKRNTNEENDDSPTHNLYDAEVKMDTDLAHLEENKRNWNQLQGIWGKRSEHDADEGNQGQSMINDEYDTDINEVKRAWNQLQGVWGKRSWNKLQGAWGKRTIPQVSDHDELVEKRAWNQMQGAWGKRAVDSRNDEVTKRSLSVIRRALGKRELLSLVGKGKEWSRKRETGWNNLKGLWG